MLDSIISSKLRIRLLTRFLTNAAESAYLRELGDEFGVSPGHLKTELDRLTQAGILSTEKTGRRVFYKANQKSPLFPELQALIRKNLGLEQLVESILQRLGHLEKAYLIGDYARGIDSGVIDLLLVGEINEENLIDLVRKAEKYIGRKIRTLSLTRKEFQKLRKTLLEKSYILLFERPE